MARRIWANGQPGNTPLTAQRLNEMEDDIERALAGSSASATNLQLDTDGIPYYELGAVGGPSLQADTDGVPYFN